MPANPYIKSRYRSFFGPQDPEPVRPRMNPPSPYSQSELFSDEPEEDDDMQFFRQFQEIQEKIRSGPDRTAYTTALKEQPTMEQYAPSKMRRFGGVVAGIAGGLSGGVQGGVDTARNFVDAPYNAAMRDWKAKTAGLGEAAKLEQENLESQGKAIEFGATLGLNRKRFYSEDAARRSTMRLNDARAQKLLSPEYDKIPQANGDILLINKNNPADRFTMDSDTAEGLRARAAGSQAQAAHRRAGASESQAQTAAGEFDFKRNVEFPYRERQDIVNRNVDIWDKSRTQPTQSSRATEEVLKAMSQDAAFNKFIKIERGFPYLKPNVNTGTPEYRHFYDEYRRRLQQYTEQGGIGLLTAPPEPGRFRIVPEQ